MILQKSARFLMIFLCAIMFHGNVFAVDDLDCTRIGWGLDGNNNCVQCSGAAGVKETKTPPSDSEYCYYAGNEIYDIVDNGDRCTVNIHICYSCSGTDNPYPNENHSECTTCKDTGYGVVDGVCVKCADNQNSSYDQNMDANVCVENDPCASADGSCLTAGCGMGDDNCQQCSEDKPYSLKIKKNNETIFNVCVSAPSSTDNYNCNDNDKTCVCKSGYYSERGIPNALTSKTALHRCVQCLSNNEYITDEDNACMACPDGQVADHVTNKCVCPGNQTFDETKQKCGCESGYGLDNNNICTELGDGQIVNDISGKIEKCDFGSVPNVTKDKCITCDEHHVANENQTACVETCEGDGVGKLTQYKAYGEFSQCVKCFEHQMVENNGVCSRGCDEYQIEQQDGSCGYCNLYYNFDTETCVNTCNNSYTVSAGDTNVNVCCGEYQYFDTEAGECKSCGANQWFEERTCKSCPKNFACNGKTKIKCPFGTVSEAGTGACASKDFPSGDVLYNLAGFLYNLDGVYTNVSENDYYKADDKDYYERFVYDSCSKVNGYREHYEIDLGEQYKDKGYTIDTTNIYVCHQCENTERPNVSGGCLCGQRTNPTAGLIKDIVPGGHGEICQVCPSNNVKKVQQDTSYTCTPCPEGQGFYWDNGKYVCTECPDGTGLYFKNKYTWCLTHTELMAVMGQDAEAYYVGDENVWDYCLAGSCCLDGKKYSCKKGTVSLANTVCENGTPGQCKDCGGKTTKSEGTSCNGFLSIDACKSNMCTVSIVPTTFCFGGENKKEIGNKVANMCFEIEKIKMSLKEGVGVYNTTDITGQTNSGQ